MWSIFLASFVATNVLLSGCSAGGLSTWLHNDYVRETFVPSTATFMAMPDSGFFLEYEGYGDYISAMQWIWKCYRCIKFRLFK